MAKKTKLVKSIQKVGEKIWAGVLYVWKRPLLISGILLILAVLLFNVIIKQTFKPYMNCNYLIVDKLSMDSFFCKGYNVKAFGSTVFKIPGLNGVMNPPLEFVRKVIAWSVVLFFAFLSMFLTIWVNNIKTIVKILTFNKEEWRRFMASARIWLLFFVVFCSIFYFTVIR
jgi:hypothetical protein